MAKTPTAGALRSRVHFQKRATTESPWLPGQTTEGDFETVFTCAAEFVPLRGSETVMASRLQGVQPYIVRVRQSSQTRQVETNWKIVDARDGREFAIKAITDPDQKRAWLEFLVEQGRIE